jgi:hypothetical protein
VNTAERLSTGKGYIDFKCVTMSANKRKEKNRIQWRERERDFYKKTEEWFEQYE